MMAQLWRALHEPCFRILRRHSRLPLAFGVKCDISSLCHSLLFLCFLQRISIQSVITFAMSRPV